MRKQLVWLDPTERRIWSKLEELKDGESDDGIMLLNFLAGPHEAYEMLGGHEVLDCSYEMFHSVIQRMEGAGILQRDGDDAIHQNEVNIDVRYFFNPALWVTDDVDERKLVKTQERYIEILRELQSGTLVWSHLIMSDRLLRGVHVNTLRTKFCRSPVSLPNSGWGIVRRGSHRYNHIIAARGFEAVKFTIDGIEPNRRKSKWGNEFAAVIMLKDRSVDQQIEYFTLHLFAIVDELAKHSDTDTKIEHIENFVGQAEELKVSDDLFDKKMSSVYEKAAAVLKASCSVT